MCLIKNWQNLTIFFAALMSGIGAAQFCLIDRTQEVKQIQTHTFKQITFTDFKNNEGIGIASCSSMPGKQYTEIKISERRDSLQLKSKPRALYTETAHQNNIEGTVTLKVTFLATGEIGDISPVVELPYGLTEQAITAAEKIRFEPEKLNGKPINVIRSVQYRFEIY